MFIVIWEYQVKRERLAEFEAIYSVDGAWATLFQRGAGFQGTELFRAEKRPRRYITIDRWSTSQHYAMFLTQWATEYAALDALSEGLTEQEILLGKWESILP